MARFRAAVYLLLATLKLSKRTPQSLTYLLKAKILGSKNVSSLYGFILEFGIIVPKDLRLSEKVYMNSFGNLFSSLRLSFLKTFGRAGIVIDITEAKKHSALVKNNEFALNWLKFASDLGLREAQFCLALAYHNGTVFETQPQLAFEYCELAANQGLSQAENLLGNMYCEGTVVEIDYTIALDWYFKSARQMEPSAIYNIGTMFERGLGVEPNLTRAVEWYTRATRFGSTNAHNVLGILIEQGLMLDEDETIDSENAVEHYLYAAANGDSHAQYNLGRCYHDGFGCMKNNAVALRWFERSANQGHKLGLMSAGICYELGIGCEKNLDQAIKNYTIACASGCENAKKRLMPIVVERIREAGQIFLTANFNLPMEIRYSILSKLNIGNVLSQSELNTIFNAIHKRKTNDIRKVERLYTKAHQKVCSCPSKSCERIMHVMCGISQLEVTS